MEAGNQRVIPPALEHRSRPSVQKALKHQAIVVIHLSNLREIHLHGRPHVRNSIIHGPQFPQRIRHHTVEGHPVSSIYDLSSLSGQLQKPAQGVRSLTGKTRPLRCLPQGMGRFIPNTGDQLLAALLRRTYGIQKARNKAHMAHLQQVRPPSPLQTLDGQANHFSRGSVIHRTHALQAHLADFLKGMAFQAGPVHSFTVVILGTLLCADLPVFGNGQRHIRLQRQQPSVQIRKGDDLF